MSDLLNELPEHLLERTRQVGADEQQLRPNGEFVLYWLHHAMRAHENPALDAAVSLANKTGASLLVYQSLPEHYPYASDRHHQFVLEGARDLAAEFEQRGIRYEFALERGGKGGAALRQLCDKSVVTVTEDLPVDPLRRWTRQLAGSANSPVLAVDTACVVPMQVVGKAYERAYQYRQATEAAYAQRLRRPWTDVPLASQSPALELPFEPLQLQGADLAELISECDIDHTVGPVAGVPGGTKAGYARWETFKQSGLATYARRRNNPLVDGTSRLSPYLHYGMVSPLRIAREAALSDVAGADKYLDELLIWRELAYAFCFYRPQLETLEALPRWAQQTLLDHQADPRQVLTWETLARGRSGDRLWDAAQRSLLIHGELHNNVRMTWGKALLNWTADPQTALATMIDLNHRFALDGRDPASYGGILWCLGQFDRPFTPARPIFGTVRDRSTKEHAKRLDLDRYWQQTTRPRGGRRLRVAVVGAGISGLICARTLADHGATVTVFEKSRGVGGRMATRRTEQDIRFDHGAQYFTARDERFARLVESWRQNGVVDQWRGRVCALNNGVADWSQENSLRYVGVPGMNAVCRHLATDLDVRFQTTIQAPQREGRLWHLKDASESLLGEFDWFVSSAPAAQSALLLQAAPALQSVAAGIRMNGCWAAMLAFDSPLPLPYDGAFVRDSPLSWIARNSSKPGRRSDNETWVLHASPHWSEQTMEQAPADVLPQMIDAFWQATGIKSDSPQLATAHRWRYAIPPEPLQQRCLTNTDLMVGACGDWCGGPRVEGAFLSGAALAGRILSAMPEPFTAKEAKLF